MARTGLIGIVSALAALSVVLAGCKNQLLTSIEQAIEGLTRKDSQIVIESDGAAVNAGSTVPVGDMLVTATVGSWIDRSFTVTNQGTGDLSLVGSPAVQLNDPTHYTVQVQPPDKDLAPGESTTFTVRFDPGGFGKKSVIVTIPTNDPSANPFSFSVSGTGSVRLDAPFADNREFGRAVAISDSFVVVADTDHNLTEKGWAHAIAYTAAGTFGTPVELVPDLNTQVNSYGCSVAVYGDYAILGSWREASGDGQAFVFYKNQGGAGLWGRQATLAPKTSGQEGYFGQSVGIAGSFAVVGGPYPLSSKGQAFYVYKQASPPAWYTDQAYTSSQDNDRLGTSVSASGSLALVGAPGHETATDINGYAILLSETSWGTVIRTLAAADGAVDDLFGSFVSLSGDYAVIGSPGDDDRGGASGSAYIFYKNQGGADLWGQQAKLLASDGASADRFGSAVALSGSLAAVGASLHDASTGTDAGAVYVFKRNGTAWAEELKLVPFDAAAYAVFGSSVGLYGSYLLVGAPDGGTSGRGAVYLYYLE